MQTRKRWLSIILVLATFISVLFCTGMNVCAESVTDGITVSVSSDKAEYDSDDEVKLEIIVKNSNDFEVSNLRIENILPDGIKIVSGKAVEENVTLKAEGEKTVKLSVAKANVNSGTTPSTSSTPKTGESGIMTILLAVLLIAGVIIVFALKGKKGFKFFSVVLCLCLIGQIAPETLVNAQNSTSEDSLSSLTAECTYTIDGTEYLHKVVVSYDNVDVNNSINDIQVGQLYTPNPDDVRIDEESGMRYMDNIIIIYFEPNISDERKSAIVCHINGKIVGKISDGIWEIEVASRSLDDLKNLITELEKIDGVFTASYDMLLNVTLSGYITPDDPWKKGEDWVETGASGFNWGLEAIQAQYAWNYNNKFNPISIGIVDSGFDTGHEDLDIRFVSQLQESVNNKDDHGTHVAGIIGATANNKKGITGIVWNKDLICYDCQPTMFQSLLGGWSVNSAILAGITKTVESGAYVVNLSYTLPMDSSEVINGVAQGLDSKSGRSDYQQNMLDGLALETSKCLAYLRVKGHDFVAVQSAGNGDVNKLGVDAKNAGFLACITPQNCFSNASINADDILDRIIVVGAAEQNGNGYSVTEWSNCGAQVDVVAPGKDIYSTVTGGLKGNYKYMDGTSMAAPIVTGIASLVWSVNKNFTGAEVKDIVCNSYSEWVRTNTKSVYTKSPYADVNGYLGYPMVNAKLAVEEAIRRTDAIDIPESDSKLPAIVQTVYENEKMWLDDVNKLATEYDDATLGYNECWFQDLDMDGTPEFIVGGMGIYFSDFPSHVYHIYKYDNGALKRVEVNDDTANNNQYLMVMWGDNELNSGCDAFELLQTFKNESTGKYLHTIKSKHNYSDSSGAAISFSAYNMSGTEFKSDGDIVYCSIDGNGSIDGSYRVHTQNDETDENTFISTYDNYFADLTPYKTTIKAIPCSDESIDMPNNYDQMTADEKKQALLDSYNAWSFEVDTNAELPLESYINKLREAYNDEDETGTQYSAIDLINKTIPEIIDIMGGEYEVTEGPTSGDVYIYNHSTLPGIQLRVFIDWLRAWDNDSLNVKQIKEDLESGFYNDFWIEVHDNAFATPDISADMNYEECCSILGELECVTGTIGTGAPDSECYIFIEDDKQIELHFDRILDGNYIHSYDEMIQYNPHLICVLVKHANQG